MEHQKPVEEVSAYESLNSSGQNEDTEEQSTEYQTAQDPDDIYGQPIGFENVPSDPEDNEVQYVVYVEPTNVEMTLVVSDKSIREKDVVSGR